MNQMISPTTGSSRISSDNRTLEPVDAPLDHVFTNAQMSAMLLWTTIDIESPREEVANNN